MALQNWLEFACTVLQVAARGLVGVFTDIVAILEAKDVGKEKGCVVTLRLD